MFFAGYGQFANMLFCKSFGPDRIKSDRSDPYQRRQYIVHVVHDVGMNNGTNWRLFFYLIKK